MRNAKKNQDKTTKKAAKKVVKVPEKPRDPTIEEQVTAILSGHQTPPESATLARAIKRYQESNAQLINLDQQLQRINQQVAELQAVGQRLIGKTEGYYEDVKELLGEINTAKAAEKAA